MMTALSRVARGEPAKMVPEISRATVAECGESNVAPSDSVDSLIWWLGVWCGVSLRSSPFLRLLCLVLVPTYVVPLWNPTCQGTRWASQLSQKSRQNAERDIHHAVSKAKDAPWHDFWVIFFV